MSRIAKVATCSMVDSDAESSGSDTMRCRALELVSQAGQGGADIVCFPEYYGSLREGGKFIPEPVPGPATEIFAKLASKYNMYVLVSLVEQADKDKPYITAVLLDRSGGIVGKYRKTHLYLPDFEEGERYSPGDDVPVFETDFGKVGITLCMDIHYPELYRVLALQGAEIIFWPSVAMDYTGDLLESLVNARAVDNQVYFVCSHGIQLPYIAGKPYGRSRVVDPMGRIRADTGHFPGVAIATIDLDQTYPTWYQGAMKEAYPTMRDTLFRTRRPELYGKLVEVTK